MAKESTGQAASKKQIIMVGVALAVLLGVVYFMFLRGGEEPVSSTAPAPAAEATPAEDEPNKNDNDKADAPKKKGKGPVETSEVFGGKDPFEAVLDLTPDAGGGGGATDDGLTDDGTVAPTDDGTTPTTPTAPTAPTTPAPPTTPPPNNDDDDDEVKTGYRVTLEKVYSEGGTRKARVVTIERESWDKKTHELVDGQRFRGRFKITSIDNNDCASFLFDGEWFALCEGQHVVRK